MEWHKPENRPEQTRPRLPRSAWAPGRSGNPGGRPKVAAEVRELLREHSSAAVRRLLELVHSKNETVALRASVEILDRGIGRPTHAVEPVTEDECVLIYFANDRNLAGECNEPGSG